MKLYYDPRTVNCRKVVAGFKHMGVEFDSENVDYFAQGQQSPDYMAINPNAALPALVDGDLQLWESNAILQYGADKVGADSAYPADLATRADVNRWLLWESSAWFPTCYVYLVENVVKPILEAEPDQAILDAEGPNFHKHAGILNDAARRTGLALRHAGADHRRYRGGVAHASSPVSAAARWIRIRT